MKQHFKIAYKLKAILIYGLGEKKHFTVRHPENAECLTGIAITCTRMRQRPFWEGLLPDIAGTLALAIPDKGDVFFSESVKAEKEDFRDLTEIRLRLALRATRFGMSGTRMEYANLSIPVTQAVMEGYYEDSAVEGGPTVILDSAPPHLYQVSLYLRYKMKP